MKVIPNLKYTDKHEWVKIDGEFAYIGITAYAQNQLGEVLFVVFTERKESIRLISARLATSAERRLYYDQDLYY